MSRPNDRCCTLKPKGAIDTRAGEFWVENPFLMMNSGDNLSAFEKNRLFLNAGNNRFVDLSHASTANIDADSRGAVAADFDRDGDLDLLVVSAGGGPLRLFRNEMPLGNRVRIRLRGSASNAEGIGTRLRLTCGEKTFHRDVFAPDGFAAQSPAELLIGVGAAEQIDELTVLWPSGRRQAFTNLPTDATYVIEEGASEPRRLPGFAAQP